MHNNIDELRQIKLFKIFLDLVEIPSPSLKEDKVIEYIQNFCKSNNINCELDDYKNIYINVAAKNQNKRPILLSSHMDVIGDFSPIKIQLEDNFIKTDGTRTLGADNKVGVACALDLAYELANDNKFNHGGLEIVLTRDEENGMSGIKHVDFSKIKSKDVLVLDADKLGCFQPSGAGYTKAILKVTTAFGGHSGNDIHEKHRLNAANLISKLICDIPQGVFYANESGKITSINLGTIIAGNIENIASKIATEQIINENYMNYFMQNSVTNVINTEAQASYSIRSASREKEAELRDFIASKIKEFNSKYKELANAQIAYSEHLPIFEKTSDNTIEKIFKKAAQMTGVEFSVSSCHCGAETHIYAHKTNANGEKFSPVLIGLADIFNMHAASEKVDYTTMLKGYELLKHFIMEFNQ